MRDKEVHSQFATLAGYSQQRLLDRHSRVRYTIGVNDNTASGSLRGLAARHSMNIRILLGTIGTALGMVAGSLLSFGQRGVVVQLCLVLGFSTALISIGVEHFYRDPQMLDRFTSRRTKVIAGSVCVTLGVGLLALFVSNLIKRGYH